MSRSTCVPKISSDSPKVQCESDKFMVPSDVDTVSDNESVDMSSSDEEEMIIVEISDPRSFKKGGDVVVSPDSEIKDNSEPGSVSDEVEVESLEQDVSVDLSVGAQVVAQESDISELEGVAEINDIEDAVSFSASSGEANEGPIVAGNLQEIVADNDAPSLLDEDNLENGEGGDLALGVLEVQLESLRNEYDGNESYELVVSSSEETVNPLSEEDDELLDHQLGGETGTHNNPNDEADNDAGDGHPDSQLGGDTGTQNKPIDNGDNASTTTEDYQSAVTYQNESDSDNISTGLPSAFCRR